MAVTGGVGTQRMAVIEEWVEKMAVIGGGGTQRMDVIG